MISNGPSSQGFAFQYVLPLPFALLGGRGNLGGILRDNLCEGNCASKIAARQWGVKFCREASRCLAGPSGQVSRFSGTEKQPKHKVFGPVVPWTSGRISGRTSRSNKLSLHHLECRKMKFLVRTSLTRRRDFHDPRGSQKNIMQENFWLIFRSRDCSAIAIAIF